MKALTMDTQLKGKHILYTLLGFFGVIFAVNGYFLYSALVTLPGEERGATYEAGLHYNATLASERAQDALHWSHKSELLPGGRIAISISDAEGAPVAGLVVEGRLDRPASSKSGGNLIFRETGTGRYEAASSEASPGAWVFAFLAQKPRPGGDPAIYRAKERLWISSPR